MALLPVKGLKVSHLSAARLPLEWLQKRKMASTGQPHAVSNNWTQDEWKDRAVTPHPSRSLYRD